MNDHHDHQTVRETVDEIMMWQHAAQHLPLTDVNGTAVDLLNELAAILNTFNVTCRVQDQADDVLAPAVMEVARQATAVAIFMLGLNQRVRFNLAAELN
jgi:hypothetical protein